LLIDEISPKKYYSQFKKKWDHILLGGALDALTTLIALSVFSLQEVNPLVNHLMPDNAYLVPFVLVEMAFLRYAIVSAVFKTTKYLNFAVYFTLYSLPIWNIANMIYIQSI
jgi:hypothetical protein